jgi:UPF0755 protein
MTQLPATSRSRALIVGMTALLASGCSAGPRGTHVDVRIERGAGALRIGRELRAAGLIEHPRLFALYANLRGSEDRLKAGHYRFRPGQGWPSLLRDMEEGRVVTLPVTVPEGFTVAQIAPRLAEVALVSPDSVRGLARDSALARRLGVPGPTLEGYLFPDTYRFAEGIDPRKAMRAMVDRYHEFWTPEMRARADSIGLDERQVVTLASIVEKEARRPEERPVIAGVYLNRLRRGMRLQADPTVQFALGTTKARLLYRDIDRVADDPYNTYTHAGLPPGPIASPGEASLRAVLWPAAVPYLFFVARPDGSHVFSVTEREHVRAKNRIRREREEAADSSPGSP